MVDSSPMTAEPGVSFVKSKEAIEAMRVVGRMTADVLTMIAEHVQPGTTTLALDQRCHDYIVNTLGAVPSCLGYQGYPNTVCTSLNHVVCHGIPNERPLKHGDILNLDVTVQHQGYHGDSSRMFVVGGTTSILADRLVKTTREALYAGIREVRPGQRLGDVGHAIQRLAKQARFSVVESYCGHGIGLAMHEDPQVLHVGKPGTGVLLEPGMTFTIEPMLNAGKARTKCLPDGWTVVTKDRSLSAQWEHTLLVTETGCDILTHRDDDTLPPSLHVT